MPCGGHTNAPRYNLTSNCLNGSTSLTSGNNVASCFLSQQKVLELACSSFKMFTICRLFQWRTGSGVSIGPFRILELTFQLFLHRLSLCLQLDSHSRSFFTECTSQSFRCEKEKKKLLYKHSASLHLSLEMNYGIPETCTKSFSVAFALELFKKNIFCC